MKKRVTRSARRLLSTAALIVAMATSTLALTGCVKVVKIGEEAELTGQKTFDVASEVDAMWDEKLIPELVGEASNLSDVLTAIDQDEDAAEDTYGVGASKGVFVVKGTGTVETVEDGQNGALVVRPDGYAGATEVRIQVGPIYKGTAIRDALSFVSAQDVTNQVEWANLSKAINDKVASDVVGAVDLTSAQGKKVSFTGCFSGGKVLIVPVVLELT